MKISELKSLKIQFGINKGRLHSLCDGNIGELCKNGRTDNELVWSVDSCGWAKEPHIRNRTGSREQVSQWEEAILRKGEA